MLHNQYFLISVLICHYVQGFLLFHKLELQHQATLLQKHSPDVDRWIEQKLDNFQPADHRIWLQRYYIQTAYDLPTGPVFLQIGGEGPANFLWMNNGHWISMAKQYGAICFFLEHRFYGKSHPTQDASNGNLMFLSSEQALADVANFIVNATSKYNLQNRKWIVFGGSYSGALSIWARLKYPHLIAGAISASAPLKALVDFYGYLDVVNHSLKRYGSTSCVNNIEKATHDVALQLTSAEGRSYLKTLFNLCEPLNMNELDGQYLQQALAGNIMGIVQYNKDNRHFEGALGTNITIETVCNIMEDSSLGSPIERYAYFNQMELNVSSQKCLDASYSKFIKELMKPNWSDGVGGRAWLYQTCTEFGWYQSTDSQSQPFIGFPLNFTLDVCKSVFGISPKQVQDDVLRTNEMYGSLQIAQVVSNVTLYNGGVDPWSNVSYVMQSNSFSSELLSMEKEPRSGILPLFVPDTAHCAIMYPSSPQDSPALTQARNKVEETLATWLGVSIKLHV